MMNRKKGIMISVAVIAVIGAAAFILGGRGGEEGVRVPSHCIGSPSQEGRYYPLHGADRGD
ncbi:MAG: hypothetical protein ACLR0U_25205 [Enterocloster clostridioformis]